MPNEVKSTARRRSPCTSKPVEGPFDTIVIGSGISGLASAAVLAKTGDRVLVLEQHYAVGGFTHVFRRKGFEWDVGVHYIGTIHDESDWYLQISALTEGRLGFAPLGELTDRITFPGLQVDMPETYAQYKEVLAQQFPSERDGISRYLDKIADTRSRLTNYFASVVPPARPLTWLARKSLLRTGHDAATSTTDEVMARYIKDEQLKDVLDAQWGNIGLPRDKCAFIVHAAMLGYYLESGAVYPIGGSGSFAVELGKTIYDHGGVIRIRAEVDEIMTHGNEVVGVRLTDGEEIRAKRVISTAGLTNTYGKLLGEHPATAGPRREVRKLSLAYEYMNLFLGFDKSPANFGLGKENHWNYRSWDTTADYFWDADNPDHEGRPKIIFLNSSSTRDPWHGLHGNTGHNAQVVFIGKQGAFDTWDGTRWMRRGEEYEQTKERYGDLLIDALDDYLPGLKESITVREVATPLTYRTFSGHPRGVPYGLAPTPDRYRALDLRPNTPIKGLFVCGQDIVMPGVSAAFGSAMMCTSLIRRKNIGSMLRKQGKRLLG
jgi:all-trans-retinol 13,14-reductase